MNPAAENDDVSLAAGWKLHPLLIFAICFSCVLCLGLIGIYARPEGDWSAFWPANAVLLGILIRLPGAASSPAGWTGALIGYLAADLLTGGDVYAAGLLTAGNMSGVAVGTALLQRLDPDDVFLRRPRAIMLLAVILALAAALSGVVGGLAAYIFFGHSYADAWLSWFLTELVNYVAIVPMVLTVPAPSSLRRIGFGATEGALDLARVAPAAALALSIVAALLIGGPGAPSYPMPALLWCALTYSIFATACLTFLLSMWILMSVLAGIMFVPAIEANPDALISIRLGVMMMALAPITVASATYARQELLDKLRHLASRDPLTNLLNRKAFTDEAEARLADLKRRGRPVALAMIDLDRFKEINDSFGHTGGDEVLVTFARLLSEEVSDEDSVARMGGEEFSILLPDCDRQRAAAIAERIRGKIAGTPVRTSSGAVISATVSLGLAVEEPATLEVERLLYVADQALYRAKAAGRNCTEIS